MSTLIVEVCVVAAVERHPNADRLAVATIKGWQTCIPYNPETRQAQFKVGDKCIYFPPDSVMPLALSDRLGVTKYLAPLPKNPDGTRPLRNRVRAARLRGVASFGIIMEATDNPAWKVGDDVTSYYSITKWDPPERTTNGNRARDLHVFHRYTDIENWRNFPGVFEEGEAVVITEKIHGKNCRNGYVDTSEGADNAQWEFVGGSHNARWQEFDSDGRRSIFWEPLTPQLQELLRHLSQNSKNVVVFSELYGSGVQDIAYGMEFGKRGYAVYDISVDGQYLDHDDKKRLCQGFGVKMVPILYRGPYSDAIMEELTDGPTTMCSPEKAGAFKGREGIIITPVKERLSKRLRGRATLKSVSVDYLSRKSGTDSH